MSELALNTARAPILLLALTLGACGGGGGGDSDAPSDEVDPAPGDAGGEAVQIGDIVRYGSATLSDDAGLFSEVVAGFFSLSEGVSADAFQSVLTPGTTDCRVESDDAIGFEDISMGFIPSPRGVTLEPIDAGDVLVLTNGNTAWASLQARQAGGFLFYDLDTTLTPPSGAVPEDLTLDIPGGEFPAFEAAAVPNVLPLSGFSYVGNANITRDTRFTWDASGDSNAKVRLLATTAGGFFLEDGVSVSCVVPDTGEFSFPSDTRAALGAGFEGGAPVVSRIASASVQQDDALLIIIRESFLD